MKVFNLAASEPWMMKAMCRGADDPEAWDVDHLPTRSPRDPDRIPRAARQLCHGCPVMRDCAEWALRTEVTGMVCAGVIIPADFNRAANAYITLKNLVLRYDRRVSIPWRVR